MKNIKFITLFTCLLTAVTSIYGQTVSLQSLLKEMVDRDVIASYPAPAYITRQASSYDRATVAKDQPGWFSNWDRTQFVRVEERGSRREFVMMDVEGPGAIVRFWMTFAGINCDKGILRIYIDNSEKPIMEGAAFDILSGGAVVGEPLAASVSKLTKYENRGHNLYLPIPYSKHCKITYESANVHIDDFGAHDESRSESVYYNINYRTYSPSVNVISYSKKELANNKSLIVSVQKELLNTNNVKANKLTSLHKELTLKPNSTEKFEIKGTKAIRHLKLTIDAENYQQALRSTVLEMSFDGENTVWVPIGDFFGIGYKKLYTNTYYTYCTTNGDMESLWVMPFKTNCAITFRNYSDSDVKISFVADYSPWKWTSASMHFGSSWHQYTHIDTGGPANMSGEVKGRQDLNFVTLQGKGVYVGDAITLFNGNYGWWGEGDEKIYVDGESFPSHIGTGTEDYYGYAWCRPETFTDHPFIAQPLGTGNFAPAFTQNTRYRSLDNIPFTTSLVFDMELWNWTKCQMNYAPITYWYLLPGGKSLIKHDVQNVKEKVALTRSDITPSSIELVLEAERLVPLDYGGGNFMYQNSAIVRFSNGLQLVWTNAREGARINLTFESIVEGNFAVEALFTVAPDYGTVKLYINDVPVSGNINLIGELSQRELLLGVAPLIKGTNKLSIEMCKIGHSAKMGICGLDRLKFIAQ